MLGIKIVPISYGSSYDISSESLTFGQLQPNIKFQLDLI